MYKKLGKHIVVLLILAIALSGCGTPQTEANTPGPQPGETASPTTEGTPATLTKVTIALGYIPDVQFAPFYVALHRGYYRAEGLDVTLRNGIVTDLVGELGTGANNVNFAAVSGDELIPARAAGVPVKYVMTWYRQYPVAAASIVGKGPTLSSPADLKGKVVGIPGPYGANYIGLQALLKAAGLTLQDVQIKNINFTQAASLSAGQVDVAMVYAANEPTQLRSQGFEVSTLPVSDYAALASNGLATNEKTLSENPDLVRRVVRATLKGINSTVDDPEGAFQESLKQIPELSKDESTQQLQRQVLTETIKLMQPKPGDPSADQPVGWVDADVWTKTQDALFDFGIIKKKLDVEEMFTNEFVD
ncbi:MAG TPA: ABC transporter substrate-binding protein [Chloroflexia bacterium]|jgi:NitT/TauT family transport system substrate-binding protein